MAGYYDTFFGGNEMIEAAIDQYYKESSKEALITILDVVRQRMHADGHFIFPVLVDEEDENRFAFRTIQTKDGKIWNVAFTSYEEYEKGEPCHVIPNNIDSSLKFGLETKTAGFIINPWGKSFLLGKDLIEMIFKADGDEEYSVPDEPITEELLEDGSFLKRAIGICNRNRTQLNLFKLARILRDSWVWVPCTAIMSDADYEQLTKLVVDAQEKGDLSSIIDQEVTSQDNIRMVPDILQNGDSFFFPVFSSEEEMGEYGEHFSKVQKHILEVIPIARNNEKKVSGIVLNAFTEPFVLDAEIFDMVENMKSRLEKE